MRSISILATALLASIPALADSTTANPSKVATTATSSYRTGVEEPSANPTLNVPVVQGCYSSQGELVKQQIIPYNSKDSCAKTHCNVLGKMVAGTMGGNLCYCGDKYPPRAALAADSECNIGCAGYDQQACGGFNSTTNTYYWTIYNTGISLAVLSSDDDILSSSVTSSSSSTTTAAADKTVTVVPTGKSATPTSTPTETASSGKSKSNTVGIAVGVVVGIVALAAISGGIFFYMRRKRNRELDEKNHRDAVLNNFFGNKPGSSGGYSISDARLDPVMAQRRVSNGSIADNQDYSRKILRVTNA